MTLSEWITAIKDVLVGGATAKNNDSNELDRKFADGNRGIEDEVAAHPRRN